jgi:hypothetical protein
VNSSIILIKLESIFVQTNDYRNKKIDIGERQFAYNIAPKLFTKLNQKTESARGKYRIIGAK